MGSNAVIFLKQGGMPGFWARFLALIQTAGGEGPGWSGGGGRSGGAGNTVLQFQLDVEIQFCSSNWT